MVRIKIGPTSARLDDVCRHSYNYKHVVKVMEQSWSKETTLTVGQKQ